MKLVDGDLSTVAKQWLLLVDCHTDDITDHDAWKRWPLPLPQKVGKDGHIDFRHKFGEIAHFF